jgi:ribose transport system substrate-binding protein
MTKFWKIGTGLAMVFMAVGASHAQAEEKSYVVGISNTLIGNGWREEMICSIKAQAKASGLVKKVILANRNAGPTEQIADIRNLVSAGANAIIINPSDRTALNAVIKEAAGRGIVVVSVDQAVTAPEAYVVSNDQVAYGATSAKWLAKQLGGKGSVIEMRGIDGVPADSDRHEGFTDAMKAYPNIKVTTVFNGWSLNTTSKKTKDIIASGEKVDGIFTTGQDAVVVEAYKTAGIPYPLIVGADNNSFIGQLVDLKTAGLIGAAVTNPAAIGGAGLAVALDVLQGKHVDKAVKLDPQVWTNVDEASVQKLKAAYNPSLDPYYSVAVELKPYTTYDTNDVLACKGP